MSVHYFDIIFDRVCENVCTMSDHRTYTLLSFFTRLLRKKTAVNGKVYCLRVMCGLRLSYVRVAREFQQSCMQVT